MTWKGLFKEVPTHWDHMGGEKRKPAGRRGRKKPDVLSHEYLGEKEVNRNLAVYCRHGC